MSSILKKSLREALKEKRKDLFERDPQASQKAAQEFLSYFEYSLETKIGFYWPKSHELDPRPLMHILSENGYECCLPRVAGKGLIFHLWNPALKLQPSEIGIDEPPASSPVLEPDVVLIPLLGFDRSGHRIGYGKGHFDYYLENHKGVFIGFGFAGQEIEKVPFEGHDIRLHYIVTEKEVIPC